MSMKIYKPTKSDLIDAAIVAVLLIVIAYATSWCKPHLAKVLSPLGEFTDLGIAVIVGFIIATILVIIKMGRLAALAFALAVGVALSELVLNKVKI